ncbi:MAG: DUF480 domain-containing protein [Gammaproteobacteria bacterium]|nr:DUF480 domain-containing protein [Gammaproteobacteria bacterium]
MEKELATPDAYPLTLNSAITACNQKTNRTPVMTLTQGEVGHALRELEGMGLVRSDFGARSERFEQTLTKHAGLRAASQAVIAMLMLRGPQSINELLARTERYTDLETPEDVEDLLNRLMSMEVPLVKNLGHHSGQREDRYGHLLSGEPALPEPSASGGARGGTPTALEQRVIELEAQVAALTERLTALENG